MSVQTPWLEFNNTAANEEIRENGYFAYLGLIAVFVLILVFRDILGLPVPKYVFIGIACVIFLISDLSKIMAFLAFVTPISLGVSYTFMTFIALVFIVLKSEKIDIGISVVFPFLIILIEVINSFLSTGDTLPEFLRSVVMIVLLALLFLDRSKKYDARLSLYMYLFGYVVLVFFTLYWVTKTGSIQEYLRTGTTLAFGLVSEFEGNKVFAASYAMGLYSVMTISVCLLLLYVKEGSRILLLGLTILSFVMGFVSTSRSFVFSAILCVFLYVLFSARSTRSVIKVVAVSCLLFLVVLLLVNTILSQQYATFIEKMHMADVSNGRFDLFRYYNEIFLSSPRNFLIGVGLQNYAVKCGSYWNSIHNATQEVLIAWGMIGFICIVGFFSALYYNTVGMLSRNERSLMYIIPGIVYLFYIQFHQMFSVRSNTMVVIIAFCVLALNEQLVSEREGNGKHQEFREGFKES